MHFEISVQNAASQAECQDLRQQLQSSNELFIDLRKSLTLKEEHSKLLEDLQAKAVDFENFIQTQTTSPNHPPSRCASAPQPSSPTTTSTFSTSSRKDEERIAKVFAAKLKQIEDAAATQETHFRNIVHELQLSLNQHQHALDIRNGEVEMLKHAILSERQKTEETMDEVLDRHTAEVTSYMKRLKTTHSENDELRKRLDELKAQRKADLEKLHADHERWMEEKDKWIRDNQKTPTTMCLDEMQLKSRITQLEATQEKIIAEWDAKYKKMKKTAASYKVG